jgi:phosphatidate cytidylyltransferase
MLKARVITALVLLACVLVALFLLPPFGWTIVVTCVIAIAAWEWSALGGMPGNARIAYSGATALISLLLAVWTFGWPGEDARALWAPLTTAYVIGIIFWVLAVPVWLVHGLMRAGAAGAVLIGWLVLLPAGLAMVHVRGVAPAPFWLLGAMAGVWAADIAAYFVGRAFGRHKLAPAVSPGKTWEGAAGAVLGVWVYALVVAAACGELDSLGLNGILIGAAVLVLLTGVSIVGDLFESLAKRHAGVKDSGTLLPGHGGVLDRVDSLTSTLPLIGLILLIWRG